MGHQARLLGPQAKAAGGEHGAESKRETRVMGLRRRRRSLSQFLAKTADGAVKLAVPLASRAIGDSVTRFRHLPVSAEICGPAAHFPALIFPRRTSCVSTYIGFAGNHVCWIRLPRGMGGRGRARAGRRGRGSGRGDAFQGAIDFPHLCFSVNDSFEIAGGTYFAPSGSSQRVGPTADTRPLPRAPGRLDDDVA